MICDKTDLPIEQCAHCQGHTERFGDYALKGPIIDARFPSRCPRCDKWIEEGRSIYLTTDQEWICADCAKAVSGEVP